MLFLKKKIGIGVTLMLILLKTLYIQLTTEAMTSTFLDKNHVKTVLHGYNNLNNLKLILFSNCQLNVTKYITSVLR